MDIERAVNTILEVSGRKPFSKVELGTAVPILTQAVNADLAARLESAERERDTLDHAARIMDGALAAQSDVNAALMSVMPRHEDVHGAEREKWQRLIDAVSRAADYAEANVLTETRLALKKKNVQSVLR